MADYAALANAVQPEFVTVYGNRKQEEGGRLSLAFSQEKTLRPHLPVGDRPAHIREGPERCVYRHGKEDSGFDGNRHQPTQPRARSMVPCLKIGTSITLASAALMGAVFATAASAAPGTVVPRARFNGFSLGYKYTHYKRHEPGVTTKGSINGGMLGYEHLGSPFYFDFNVSYDTGNVNYNGAAQIPNGNGGYSDVPLNDHTNLKALVTYNIDVGPAFSMFSGRNIVAPFIGTGGQYIYGASPKANVTYAGTNYTVPEFARKNLIAQAHFGVVDRYGVTNRLQVEGKAEGLINLTGRYSDNTGGNGTYSGGDLGTRFKLRADYRISRHFGVFASGEYYYFQTPKINSLGTNSFEPAAKKHEYSATLGLTIQGL